MRGARMKNHSAPARCGPIEVCQTAAALEDYSEQCPDPIDKVREAIMERAITHPTKEQVRAYMAEREAARRPPPAPDEIRRQLGWQLCPSESSSPSPAETAPPGSPGCAAPPAGGQLVAVLLFHWFFSPWQKAFRYYSPR